MPDSKDEAGQYHIGTVAGLTGIDAHTIRAWERRYGAVSPLRSARGTRIYDEACVERLQLLKALVDCGEPIGKVANLEDAELRDRLSKLAHLGASRGDALAVPRAETMELAVLGGTLAAQLSASHTELPGFHLSVQTDRPDAFVELVRTQGCDAMLVQLAALGPAPLRTLDRCLAVGRPRLVIVIYSFAQRAMLARLARRGVKLLRGPMRFEQVCRALGDLSMIDHARQGSPSPREVEAQIHQQAEGEIPERLFDDTQLARLSEISSSVDCECPNHLASIAQSLVAFEEYSRGCESRSEEDASLHARLAAETADARALVERMLIDLCEFDDLEV